MQRHRWFRRSFLIASGLGLCLLTACTHDRRRPPDLIRSETGASVHGFAVARLDREPTGSSQIFLPDITVYLKEAGSGKTSPEVRTDLKGWFSTPVVAPGKYQLCYQADGYVPGCQPDTLTVGSLTVFPASVEVTPEPPYLVGRVRQRDELTGFFIDPAFAMDARPAVSVTAGNAVARTVQPNLAGWFVLPGLPVADVTVTASAEAARARMERRAVDLRSRYADAEPLDLLLDNTSPRIQGLVATRNGQLVRHVPPGTTVDVTVTAKDAEQKELAYAWYASPQGEGFRSESFPTVRWTLPQSGGLHSLFVLVKDQHGGYARSRVDVSTDEPSALFSGVVSAARGGPLAGATVSVNGQTVQTGRDGSYFLRLREESPRYIVNVTRPGYALYSKIVSSGAVSQRVSLAPAETVEIDPARRISITEKPRGGYRSGAQIVIDPGTLVGARGERAQGPLALSVASIDLRDPEGRLPGDFGAINAEGENVRLISYGAVDVQIRDAGGRSYNLANGTTATVRVPVDPAQLEKGAPSTIDLWFYDPESGLWREEGKARLVNGAYEAKVPHFSVINLDIQKNDAACIRIHSDASLTLPYNLQITVPTATGLDQVFTRAVTDPDSAIVRLPPNEPVTLQALDAGSNPIELTKQTVSSGAAIPGTADPNPPPPYTDCNADAYLSIAPPDGGFFNYFGLDDNTSANNYYAAIDEAGVDRTTLANWKTVNGFGADDASAVYFNNGDLGFGRSMHMKKRIVGPDTFIAYYVSNYPNVEAARLGINLIATVAMEFSPGPGGGAPYTKFYVFDNAGNRVNKANLDGRGDKFIPRLCVICHAGQYVPPTPANKGNMGSRFIAFDLQSFLYSGFDPAFNRASQEAQLKLLNRGVLENTNASTATAQLIEGWYGGAGLPNPTVNDSFFPPAGVGEPGWTGTTNLYDNVVKPSCRTCHVNRDAPISWVRFDAPGTSMGNPAAGFKQYGPLIEPFVCGPFGIMPHGKQPYVSFWASGNPHRPTVLRNSGTFPAANPCPAP